MRYSRSTRIDGRAYSSIRADRVQTRGGRIEPTTRTDAIPVFRSITRGRIADDGARTCHRYLARILTRGETISRRRIINNIALVSTQSRISARYAHTAA